MPVQLVAGEDGVLWGLVPRRIDPPVYSSSDGGRTWAERGTVVGTPLVGNPLRVHRLRMDTVGRLWLGATRGADPNTATGAVLRTAAPVTVVSEDGPGKPGEVALGAAYPNPASGAVTVPLVLGVAADVRLVVYDVLGREVAVLHEGPLAAGEHALAFDAVGLPTGVYLVRATGDGFHAVQHVTVIR